MKKVLLLMVLCAGLNAGETNAQDLMDVKTRLESISRDIASANKRLSIVELEEANDELKNMLSQTQALSCEMNIDIDEVLPLFQKIKVEMENIESYINKILDFYKSRQLQSRAPVVAPTRSRSKECCNIQ